MQGAKLGCLAMGSSGWDREPLGGVRKVERLIEVELGVVTQPCRLIGNWIARAQDRKLATI